MGLELADFETLGVTDMKDKQKLYLFIESAKLVSGSSPDPVNLGSDPPWLPTTRPFQHQRMTEEVAHGNAVVTSTLVAKTLHRRSSSVGAEAPPSPGGE
jgi:hypothetical protein